MPGTVCGYDNLSCDILSGEVRSVEVLETKRSESRGEELYLMSCCPKRVNKLWLQHVLRELRWEKFPSNVQGGFVEYSRSFDR